MKPVYIASFHQSKFGKLMGMTVPEIVGRRYPGRLPPDRHGARGPRCGQHRRGLQFLAQRAGPAGRTDGRRRPGLEGKPIEAVENACASGGQAVLSVIQKLQLGMGDTGIAVGYEKMRDAEGKMDGKLIGKVLGYFSYPGERAGKVFVFPHLFAEVMREYMDAYGVTEADLAAIAVQEYANAQFNPCAQMNKVQITLDQALKIEGINRYVVDGLPLKTYDCSQITDGYASLILATEEGLAKLGVPKAECVEIAGLGTGHRPAAQGRPRRAASGGRVPRHAHGVPDGRRRTGRRERRRGARLLHRDGRAGHGSDRQGRARQGRPVLGRRQSGARTASAPSTPPAA